jgi:hypothetical protein
MAGAQSLQSVRGQQSSLVESPLGLRRAMQRNRHHQHFIRRLGGQQGDRLRQHASHAAGRGVHEFVLQRVNDGAHRVLVKGVSHGALERRWGQPASAAKCQTGGVLPRRIQIIPAANARRAAQDGNFHPADITSWSRRKARQGRAAKSTTGGGKSTARGIQRTSEDARHSAPCGSPGWNVERQRTGVPAEDAPHGKARQECRPLLYLYAFPSPVARLERPSAPCQTMNRARIIHLFTAPMAEFVRDSAPFTNRRILPETRAETSPPPTTPRRLPSQTAERLRTYPAAV